MLTLKYTQHENKNNPFSHHNFSSDLVCSELVHAGDGDQGLRVHFSDADRGGVLIVVVWYAVVADLSNQYKLKYEDKIMNTEKSINEEKGNAVLPLVSNRIYTVVDQDGDLIEEAKREEYLHNLRWEENMNHLYTWDEGGFCDGFTNQ